MKIFYFCFGRAHSSVIAANIHLGKMPEDRVPAIREITLLPDFDKADHHDQGIPHFMGVDGDGNEVYILGFGGQHHLGLQAIFYTIHSRANLLEWKFFNTLSTINWLTRIGGFMSRTMKLVYPGRFIVATGIRKSYPKIVKFVKHTKELTSWRNER